MGMGKNSNFFGLKPFILKFSGGKISYIAHILKIIFRKPHSSPYIYYKESFILGKMIMDSNNELKKNRLEQLIEAIKEHVKELQEIINEAEAEYPVPAETAEKQDQEPEK